MASGNDIGPGREECSGAARAGSGQPHKLLLAAALAVGALATAGLLWTRDSMLPPGLPPASAPEDQVSTGPPAAPRPSLVPEDMTARLSALATELWPDAERARVSRAVFDRALSGLTPDLRIFELMANQPEHVAAPWDYLARLASEARIDMARQLLAEHRALLDSLQSRYGVDKHIVLAIWGVESNFGTSAGDRHVIRSLATLAAGDARRPRFWRDELLGALRILERGDIAIERMTGSWAGAMGHTQFMPTSYLAYAVDQDGDGRRDIWQSIPDALGSTANFLKVSGWRTGEPWGTEVVLPAGFDYANARPGISKSASDWQALGVAPPLGRDLPVFGAPLSLLLPAGARGPAFLVSPSFRAILRYNNSVSYALAVGHLADRMRGGPIIAGLWPTDDPPLKRQDREELQKRLAAAGHDIATIDGVIGSGTRNAIRAFQLKAGLPEDGYAGEQLLDRLRKSAP